MPNRATSLAALALLVSGCSVGPRYVPPATESPPAFKELPGAVATGGENWKPGKPADELPRGTWWEMYGDPRLSALIERVDISNQTVKAAEAALEQARAIVRFNRAGYYPSVSATPSIVRSRSSGNLRTTPVSGSTSTDFVLPFDFSYEVDLWGRVRSSVRSSAAAAQASAADLETARLSMQSELAADYFQLRALDAQKELLDSTVAAYERTLQLTLARRKAGVASGDDVAQAETQLETTRAQATDLDVEHAQLEHAIAVLVGEPASTFSLSGSALSGVPPTIPAGLPSELLERRPDIAAAERRVAAANAAIGNARTAFFPALTLGGAAGLNASTIVSWLSWPSRFWSLGPAVALSIFDGGARRATVAQSKADYDATVATYRQVVLTSFQEVEDNLAALRILEKEAAQQDAAVKAAARSLDISMTQYKAGTADYLQVIIAQSALLTNERSAVGILEQRMIASVRLVKALGGGWQRTAAFTH